MALAMEHLMALAMEHLMALAMEHLMALDGASNCSRWSI